MSENLNNYELKNLQISNAVTAYSWHHARFVFMNVLGNN